MTSAIGSFAIGIDAIGVIPTVLVSVGGAPPVETDIATLWDAANNRGDWALSGADLTSGSDLVTAILISLFTDRSANEDDVVQDGTGDRRGWLGDLGNDVPIGSRLWLLLRAKETAQTLANAKTYIAEALNWLIDDGVASAIDLFAEWSKPGMLGARITVYQPKKGIKTTLDFAWAWQGV